MVDAERQAGLPEGSLVAVALGDHDLLNRAVTGKISDEQWRRQIVDRLAASNSEDAAAKAVNQWSSARGAVNAEVLQLIRAERCARPVAVLTNATSRLDEDLAALALDREVDFVFNSSSLGVAKPDPAIFLRAGQILGAPLDNCVFVDDTRTHVETAALLGMTSHLFTEPSALMAFLAEGGAT